MIHLPYPDRAAVAALLDPLLYFHLRCVTLSVLLHRMLCVYFSRLVYCRTHRSAIAFVWLGLRSSHSCTSSRSTSASVNNWVKEKRREENV